MAQDAKQFMKALDMEESPGVWAFTVYCTYPASTTTPSTIEAEEYDARVCDRFRAYVEANLLHNIEERWGLKIPLEIEFIRLPSASVAEARTHFRAKYGWPMEYETGVLRNNEFHDMRHGTFVVIDDETIGTIFEAPDPLQVVPEGEKYWRASKGEDVVVITVVNVDYDEACDGVQFAAAGRGTPKDSPNSITFYGYQKTTPRWLQKAWHEIIDFGYRKMFRGKDYVYTG